jgi:hypothetical protein
MSNSDIDIELWDTSTETLVQREPASDPTDATKRLEKFQRLYGEIPKRSIRAFCMGECVYEYLSSTPHPIPPLGKIEQRFADVLAKHSVK